MMKFLIISVLVTNWAVQVFGFLEILKKSPYDAAASDLRSKIKQTQKDLNKLQSDVNREARNAKTLDFELKKQYSVLEVQEKLNGKSYAWGLFNKAHKCKQQFETNVKILNGELDDIVRRNLTAFSESINDKKSELMALQNKLSGKGLTDELQSCKTSEKECKLTGDYDKSLKKAESFIKTNSLNLKSHHLVNDIIATEIGPILPTKIQEKIVEPANECLLTV